MSRVIVSSSTLLYLYRVGALDWLPKLFDEVLVPSVVLEEMQEVLFIGHDVPHLFDYEWITFSDPQATIPPAWVSLELSSGELAAMALAFENLGSVVLLDDALARRAVKPVGIEIWGTLKVLLEGKKRGLTDKIAPYVTRLSGAGIWVSDEIRQRILELAGENIIINQSEK
ncbi:MAG: DUF3368 domain-containing protein [Chloroflexota bacterium]